MLAEEQYGPAEQLLRELLEAAPGFAEGWLAWSEAQRALGRDSMEQVGLKRAVGLSAERFPEALYRLAQLEFAGQEYDNAAQRLEQYLSAAAEYPDEARRLLASARFASWAIGHPVPFSPQPLGNTINSPDPEYLPSLTADGETLIFTRRVANQQEDLFFSEKTAEGWLPARPLETINTPFNEAGQAVSADGRFLVFTACGRRDGQGRCDLYFSKQEKGQWSQPQNMGPPVNTPYWESQAALSPDGRVLFFASDRPGGLGGADLWQSRRLADGSWGTPENLGPPVNTSEDEQSPFFHPDERSLYFMSKGHPGMGGFDLFCARLGEDGRWGRPQNLGYPVNTGADEGGLFVGLDGREAFFAGSRPGESAGLDVDIFHFQLPVEARAAPVAYVKGAVWDAESGEALSAEVEVIALSSGDTVFDGRTTADGAFLACLPVGEDYALNISRRWYFFFSDNLALSEEQGMRSSFILDIRLRPARALGRLGNNASRLPVAPVVLQNIFFETGSAELRPESRVELGQLKRFLEENSELKIRINGHTDNVGAEADNLALSEARARAVYDHLIRQGIAPSRLEYRGYGESRPIASNDSAAGRRRNRRTEFEAVD